MLIKNNLLRLLSQVFFFVSLVLFSCSVDAAEIMQVDFQKLELKECLLPKNHPLHEKLENLFKNPDTFQSPLHLSQAGFRVFDRIRRGFMVAEHPAMGGYLIKKFQNSTPYRKQLHNYFKRINGARALKEFIKVNNLRHIVVPQKWLYRLPKQFSDPETGERGYLLIVEKIDLCEGGNQLNGDIAARYYTMDFDILRELCIIVFHFRGLDSGLQNMPFTRNNKIAFIDTEHWTNNKREGYLRHAMDYLTPEHQIYALKVFEDLIKSSNQEEKVDAVK